MRCMNVLLTYLLALVSFDQWWPVTSSIWCNQQLHS